MCWWLLEIKLLTTLTRDIRIMKRTTKLLKPSRVSPTKSMLQNELSSQAWSWELRKFTKYRNSAHEGSLMPQFLWENKHIIKSLSSENIIFKKNGYKVCGKEKEKHKHLKWVSPIWKAYRRKGIHWRNVATTHMRKTGILKLKPNY